MIRLRAPIHSGAHLPLPWHCDLQILHKRAHCSRNGINIIPHSGSRVKHDPSYSQLLRQMRKQNRCAPRLRRSEGWQPETSVWCRQPRLWCSWWIFLCLSGGGRRQGGASPARGAGSLTWLRSGHVRRYLGYVRGWKRYLHGGGWMWVFWGKQLQPSLLQLGFFGLLRLVLKSRSKEVDGVDGCVCWSVKRLFPFLRRISGLLGLPHMH